MKKLFAAGVIATVLTASTAFALDVPPNQPIRATEGPDIRLTQDDQSTQPIRETEGPDIRLTGHLQSTLPVEGPEGPDVR